MRRAAGLISTAVTRYLAAMSTPALLEVSHLHRRFGDTTVLHDINFSIGPGQVVGFLGPNGAGKSTTMRLISGNLAPTGGTITLGGYDLQRQPLTARHQFGYLPDTPPLYRDYRVDEFLHFCGRLHQLAGRKLKLAAELAVERCGLTEVTDKLIGHLSKGYQQRVGIAQAIIHEPPLVILDEPTIGLDPRQIEEIRQLIRELGQQHSILLSTHILSEVQAVCSHVQIINAGRLVLQGALADLQAENGATYLLRFQQPVDSDSLKELTDVVSCRAGTTTGQIEITLADTDRAVDQLLQQCATRGWKLRQLSPTSQSLEQLFLQITSQDGAALAEPDNDPDQPIPKEQQE